jgi:hypothetical protein
MLKNTNTVHQVSPETEPACSYFNTSTVTSRHKLSNRHMFILSTFSNINSKLGQAFVVSSKWGSYIMPVNGV